MIKDAYGNTRFYGVYRGTVFEVSTDGKNQIRARVPQLFAGNASDWAWPVGVVGTELPEVGAGVWIQFEGGDPAFPLWSGSFTNNLISSSSSSTSSTSTSDTIDGGSA